MNKRRLGVEEEAPTPTSEELLAEIRDLMANQAGGTTGTAGPAGDVTK